MAGSGDAPPSGVERPPQGSGAEDYVDLVGSPVDLASSPGRSGALGASSGAAGQSTEEMVAERCLEVAGMLCALRNALVDGKLPSAAQLAGYSGDELGIHADGEGYPCVDENEDDDDEEGEP